VLRRLSVLKNRQNAIRPLQSGKNPLEVMDWETWFDEYLEHLSKAIGQADRSAGLNVYRRGPILPLRRKSVVPLAAYLESGAGSRKLAEPVAASL
jgi:hypothetical protein